MNQEQIYNNCENYNTPECLHINSKLMEVFVTDVHIVDENGSYFNQAKQIITNLVSDFNDGDEVILLLTSNHEHSILLGNKNLNEKEIRKIKISYVTGPLSESIAAASMLINNSTNFNKEVEILADFQASTISDKKNEKKNLSSVFDE